MNFNIKIEELPEKVNNCQMVKITGTCIITKLPVERVVKKSEYIDYYKAGKYAQHAFKNLTPGEREFFISGCSEEGFDSLFPKE